MKKKNKQGNVYFVMMVICLVLAVASFIMAIVMQELLILFIALGGVFLVGMVLFFVALNISKRDREKVIEKDKDNIISALHKYQHNQMLLAKVNSDDEGLQEIATVVNDLSINDTTLEYSTLYDGNEFFTLIRKYIIKSGIEKCAILRVSGVKERTIEKIADKYPRCFIGQNENSFDLLLETFDKSELEDYLKTFVEARKECSIKLFYYDEYSLDEIFDLINQDENQDEQRLFIYDRNSEKEVFINVINKYKDIDLSKDNLLEDYLIDIFPYLPFTHMAVLIDDEYLRLVNYQGALLISEIKDKEFKTWLKMSGVTYMGKQAHIVFANENEEIQVTPQLLYKLNKVIAIINNLVLIEIDRIKVNESETRFNKLEELHESLSYEVNDDYIVTHASKKLNERYCGKLVGSYCYETLYDRESPCKNCPLNSENRNKTYMLSSKLYKRVVDFEDGDKRTIYLLNEKKPFINSRDALNERLLGLLNDANAKGYLLVFKIDSLTQLASKNKLDTEQVIDKIIEGLTTYGLTDSLYRKDVDEFVYILKYASMANAIKIAKAVSTAFLETFDYDEKAFHFLPKVILLSYPLEVNTLFSLDSLSRTLFMRVTKKGMLYRVDEEPTPIDDHRHYMDIVEEAFKNNEIPVSYFRIKDLENQYKMAFVGYRFLDENHNHIPDDQISLYVKIDKKYITFMDKFVRSFNYEDETRYVTSIGKEGLEKQLFDILLGFFETKHIPFNRVVFEAKERDIANHLEATNYALDLGFNIAIDVNDSGTHSLDMSRFAYIRIDGRRLASDKAYQHKINSIIHGDKPILMEEKYKDLITGARFVY